ncbi:polysaccharide deacetylase family protein [Streptomyces sp. NPDC001698]|uniref:polysaccharide deacetylase family protein n=1 Tax=unclassified Streptomyces TaxID=2593676 RepID=UPI0036A5E0EC
MCDQADDENRFRALTALAAVCLTLAGCARDGTAPSAARAHPAAGAPAAFGTVDCRHAKCVALTFDAGPSENSARLLDILKEEQVPATFFLLGARHIEKYPELVVRMAAEGHEVANHTWDHRIEVLWSVTAKDCTTTDSELITRRVLGQASRDGIILLHDIYAGTVPAVPGIIDALKERGYAFVTVPQLPAPGRAEPGKVYRS